MLGVAVARCIGDMNRHFREMVVEQYLVTLQKEAHDTVHDNKSRQMYTKLGSRAYECVITLSDEGWEYAWVMCETVTHQSSSRDVGLFFDLYSPLGGQEGFEQKKNEPFGSVLF